MVTDGIGSPLEVLFTGLLTGVVRTEEEVDFRAGVVGPNKLGVRLDTTGRLGVVRPNPLGRLGVVRPDPLG